MRGYATTAVQRSVHSMPTAPWHRELDTHWVSPSHPHDLTLAPSICSSSLDTSRIPLHKGMPPSSSSLPHLSGTSSSTQSRRSMQSTLRWPSSM